MIWAIEFGVLVVVAVVLRRVLHIGRSAPSKNAFPRDRKTSHHPLLSSLVSEIEALATILGVLLNDAIEEQDSGRPDNAQRMLGLFGSEWERLVALTLNVQNLCLRYLPMVQYPIDARSINVRSFRSQPMAEFLSSHEALDQFVFRSKLRFQLHLRLLRRATAALNESFEEICRDAERSDRLFDWALSQMDLYFHDLDLLTKETLLGFSSELAYLPATALEDMTVELAALTSNSVLAPLGAPLS